LGITKRDSIGYSTFQKAERGEKRKIDLLLGELEWGKIEGKKPYSKCDFKPKSGGEWKRAFRGRGIVGELKGLSP